MHIFSQKLSAAYNTAPGVFELHLNACWKSSTEDATSDLARILANMTSAVYIIGSALFVWSRVENAGRCPEASLLLISTWTWFPAPLYTIKAEQAVPSPFELVLRASAWRR